MIRMRALVAAGGVVLAACGQPALLQDAAGKLRVVAQVPLLAADAANATALRAALVAHAPVAAVVALDAAGLRAMVAAAPAGTSGDVPVVAIAPAPAAAPAANQTIVVEGTGAAAAVELALLACHGIALPPQIAVGTRTVTAANAAAGGAQRPAPGDLGLEMLRRQHPDVITTTPDTDVIFPIAFVQIRSDGGWHDRVRDEVQTAAKRHPQLALTSHVAGGASARLLGLVNECIQANLRAVLLSTDDWAALQPLAAAASERKIALIAIDPLVAAPYVTSSVGCDQGILGRAVGEAVRAALPGGGACIELHGDPGSAIAQRRHQGFVDALGLKAK